MQSLGRGKVATSRNIAADSDAFGVCLRKKARIGHGLA